ncbi:MAG: alpha/beta hydrolase [Bacteroidetes bacterium]|nr:alpha/beta hydrolase [Bacteroidota bacterium]
MNSMLLVVFTFCLSGIAFANTNDSAKRTKVIHLESEALDETREIIIRTPPNYDPENREYTVVYVLDAEWNFEYVASYLEYMFNHDTYPEMIVTGVVNVNRNRDYIPRPDSYFEDTGEAASFLEFVKNEWIGEIERKYAVSGERIVIGHSFGGVFVLHTLFSDPALFDAYIALGASAWIADGVLLEEAAAYFEHPADADAFVYMAVGEGDGGPTVPSSRNLAEAFEQSAPESLEWFFDITPKTDHFKNFTSGLSNAFMALFPAWGFADEVTNVARNEGVIGVGDWFKAKQDLLGERFHPSWFDLGVAAFTLTQEGHGDAAIELLDNLKTHYPQSGHVASFSASVFEMNGRYEEALGEYERAIEIVDEQNLHPNTIHKGNLESGIERMHEQAGKSEEK